MVACASSPTAEPPTPFQSPLLQSPLATRAPDATASRLEVPSEAPMPESQKASIAGVLYTFAGQGPIPGTLFYLTPGRGEGQQELPTVLTGPHEEDGDIAGTSDDKGWIALNDVPPGSYYLAVWAPYNWILATESDVDLTPRLISLEADQRLNLEVIYVPWP
jgi:hypothetical protein